ncbi:hypothetical protein ISCGN_005497 [Ixodes scapularis]
MPESDGLGGKPFGGASVADMITTGTTQTTPQPVTQSGAWPPANPNPNFGAPRWGGGGGPSRLLPRSASLSPSGTSIPETRSDAMVSIEVDGELISPEEITEEAGWLTSHRRRGARALAQLGLTPGHSHDQEGAGSPPTYRQPRAEKQTIRKPRLPRQPPLPKEDIKIVLRQREGLDITKISHAELRDGVLRATGLGYDEAAEDLLRINPAKNIIVASTPSMEHASKYTAVKELRYGEKSYNVTAYAAPPEDTVKGIIHDIPEYDSAEDITRSLIYKKNTTILQARRMGRTNSAIIVFEGTKVPYYVYYRGAEYRCFIHKKRHEVCDGCGRLGHRTDVCPAPDKNICKICGTEVPSENHQCEPKCALCGRDHPTGDKKCRLRFQTPYLLKKRKWEKQQIQNNRRRPQKGSGNPASTPKDENPSETRPVSAVDRAPSHASRSMSDKADGTINSYMEDNGLFPHTMIGFRPKLSTQDSMLLLRYDVIDGAHCSPLDTRAILGLDLTKAFDNVKHSAILANLGKLGLGRRVYDYISNFLSDRTATLSIGGLQSDAMELGSRGTPQGSVLSPFLFNVAMIGLPKILNQIEGLQHTLYADDVTLWVPGGSDGHIQDTLQQAIEAVEQYIGPRGLSCAPQKSELLLYRPTSRGRRTDPTPPNVALFAGRRITQAEQWETVLLSSDPADQNWVIQLAEDAARAQGLLADA